MTSRGLFPWLAVIAIIAAGCDEPDPTTPDGGPRDASPGIDSGAVRPDAAGDPDGGPPGDAGLLDAAPRVDATGDAATAADGGGSPAVDCGAVTCLYVRSGSSGDGSDWARAFAALPESLERGAVYFVADGSYPGHRFDDPASGTELVTIRKATIGDHGTDTGWMDEYGDGEAAFGDQLEFTTPHWLIDGVVGGGPGSWTSGFGFRVTQSEAIPLISIASDEADDVTIRHVDLEGTRHSGGGGSIAQDAVKVAGGRGFTLSYFYTHALGRAPFFLVPAPESVIEYGYIGEFISTDTAHSEVVSAWAWSEAGDFTFRYNIVAAITGTGGIMWDNSGSHESLARIYGNVFYRAPDALWDNEANGLIGGWTGGSGEDCFGLRVYNNSFVHTTGRIFTDFIVRSGDNEVVNNLFYDSDPPSFADIQIHDHNHYIESGDTAGEPNGTTATGDPFVDAAALDFRLLAATPGGQELGSPYTLDALGILRGEDGTWDRGAYEHP
jgi:hypothetical protein